MFTSVYMLMASGGRPFIVTDEEEFNSMMEQGIYPYTTTTDRRYVDPESVDHRIYSELKDILEDEDQEEYTLVDVASSSGEPLKAMVEQLEEETGVELNSVAADVNREMLGMCYDESRAEAVQGAAQYLPLHDDSVDFLVSSQLNLRPEFIDEAVDEFNRVLSSDGYAVLSTGYSQDENDYKGVHQGEITSSL